MLYYFLKVTVRIFIRIFYRNPLVLNRDLVPQHVPLILSSNHPNALCDPCSVAVFSKQRIHFLARGDVFRNKVLHSIFVDMLGMVPIYRLMEGAENLHKNAETFSVSAEKLKRKKTILMFPEGICIQERRLRSLKKGMARIAFASEEAAGWNLGLKVVPVGLNYTSPKKFRSDLVMQFGKPVEMVKFRDAYLSNKAAAINEFTRVMHERMSELVLHIQDPANDGLVKQAEEIIWNEKGLADQKEKKFRASETIIKAINGLSAERVSLLRQKTEKYFSGLDALGLTDETVKSPLSSGAVLLRLLLLSAGLPLHIFGMITNYPPYKGGRLLADSIVKQEEFHASVNLFGGMFMYLIWYAAQVLTVALVFRDWYLLAAFMAAVPLSGLFSLHYIRSASAAMARWKFLNAAANEKAGLTSMRKELVNELTLSLKI